MAGWFSRGEKERLINAWNRLYPSRLAARFTIRRKATVGQGVKTVEREGEGYVPVGGMRYGSWTWRVGEEVTVELIPHDIVVNHESTVRLITKCDHQKFDHDMTSSRLAPGASRVTVTPKLVVRMGRSALRPLMGLTKHHAGTAPSSTSPGLKTLSRPTMHQPSS